MPVFKSSCSLLKWLCACGGFLAAGWVGGCERDGQRAEPADEATPSTEPTAPWFVEVAREVGLKFTHESGAAGRWHMPEVMGAGAAMFDYDSDGDLDIYLTNGAFSWGRPREGPVPMNHLFRQGPHGRFEDVTAASGLGDTGYGMGIATGDIDNDGDVDVYVTNLGLDRMYRNRGDGTFEEITKAGGIKVDDWSASAVFCDFDRDGFLDLYVSRYVSYDPTQQCTDGVGRPDYCGPKNFPYLSDVLLHNNGDGTFTDISQRAGIAAVSAPGLGVVCEDLNDDGWVDIYVANDLEANQLWINMKDGTFRDSAMLMGAAFDLNGQAESGMGVLAADLDNDLRMDLFVTHLEGQTNTAYRNLGAELGFGDVTGQWGLAAGCLPYTGFGTAALDVELDGDLDLLVVNGRAFRGKALDGAVPPAPWDQLAEPNLFYINEDIHDGAGRFRPCLGPSDALCGAIEISRGLSVGDMDNDGDLDVLVSNIQGPVRLYRNDAPRKGHWLTVRAIDPRWRRDALGARVTVRSGRHRIVRTINGGFGYLSASEPLAHFGLGENFRLDDIQVRWPDGRKESFTVETVDQLITLVRGEGKIAS